MADWSSLPDGVIVLIARLLRVIDDFVVFRGTCTSWRSATSLKDFHECRHGLPLLMLVNGSTKGVEKSKKRKAITRMTKDISDEEGREFISLYKKKIIRISIPEAKGKSCIAFASKGWFIMTGSSRNVSLLNPITRVHIRLPLIRYDEFAGRSNRFDYISYRLTRAVLSASPSHTSEYVVMVLYIKTRRVYIGFWKSGDQTWKRARVPSNSSAFKDVSYHNGKFYALSSYPCQIWMFDVWNTSGAIVNATKIMEIPSYFSAYEAYLVECGGRLLMLSCIFACRRNGNPFHSGFYMLELDVNERTYTRVSSLGTNAIFLGRNEAFSLDTTRFPEVIEPNLVYLSNGSCICSGMTFRYRWDFRYNIEDGILDFDSDNNSGSNLFGNYNVWVTPSF